MSRFHSAFYILRSQGIWGIFRKLCAEIYSQTKMRLLEKREDINKTPSVQTDSDLFFRDACRQDIEKIAAVWPPEFAPMADNQKKLLKLLQSRFDRNIPCFIACERNAVVGVVWCLPWHYDKCLSAGRRNQPAYEICNIFTAPQARGKGVAEKLLFFALHQMAKAGKTVAYSRILPERTSSIKLHEKLGFQTLGLLTSGSFLGWHYSRLDKSVLHKAEEEKAL